MVGGGHVVFRIIPARAGFTTGTPARRPRAGDHPRSRGVYMLPQEAGEGDQGSSPLARGLPPGDPTAEHGAGIIPARAGFTFTAIGVLLTVGDHPRSRGVYRRRRRMLRSMRGSSPLARGLHNRPDTLSDPGRIIPARAGFTRPSTPATPPIRDHPRSRGVYQALDIMTDTAVGSSPLARGLPLAPGTVDDLVGSSPLARGLRGPPHRPAAGRRIIPARAGFTLEDKERRRAGQDHPRSRGVYPSMSSLDPWSFGSSPLARGLLGLDRGRLLWHRIIPARAGFTGGLRARRPGPSDHPRSRGVYGGVHRGVPFWLGSSPLARGLHLRIPGIPTTSHTTRPRLPSLPT